MQFNRRDMLAHSVVLATGLIVGCSRVPESPLRVGAALWPGYEPLFLSHDLNYLREQIQIVQHPGTPEVHASFQNRAIEVACVTLDEALRMAQFHPDIRVIMAIDFSNGADAMLGKPHIQSLADLKGKRIGVQLNAIGSFMLCRALEKAELQLQDVTVVPMSTAGTEAAFESGGLDAVIAYEPVCSRLRTAGATVLFDSSQIPGEIMDVMVVRTETLLSHPDSLADLLNGWFKAVDLCRNRPDESIQRASKHFDLSEEQFLNAWERIDMLDRPSNIALFDTNGGALHDIVRKLGASMKKYQLLDKMVDPSTLLDARIVTLATT